MFFFGKKYCAGQPRYQIACACNCASKPTNSCATLTRQPNKDILILGSERKDKYTRASRLKLFPLRNKLWLQQCCLTVHVCNALTEDKNEVPR